MNAFVWVEQAEILGGARFSMSATLPISNNSLSSDAAGRDQRRRRACRLLLSAVHSRLASETRVRSRRLRIPGANRVVQPGANQQRRVGVLDARRRLGSDVVPHTRQGDHGFRVPDVRIPHRPAGHGDPSRPDHRPRLFGDADDVAAQRRSACRLGWWATVNGRRPTRPVPACHRPGRGSLHGQCLGFASNVVWPQRRVSLGLQVLQGVLQPLDIPGILRADFRIGRLRQDFFLVPVACRGRSGMMVSPRESMATSAAIFRARPAGVFMLLVRKASANRF